MMRHKKILVAVMALFICLVGGRMVAQLEAKTRFGSETSTVPILTAQADTLPVPEVAVKPSDPRPRLLTIPSINLAREVIDVGIADDGKLDVPPNYTQVGWYKYGALPGEIGSAVLDGHVDNGAAIAGPFKKLRYVKIGDAIYVKDADGSQKKFIVTSSKIYPTNKFPGELVFHDKSGALLKIITCHGNFIPSIDTYDQRLIVTAKLAE
jgi:sortase (surface protein transpeptidase)